MATTIQPTPHVQRSREQVGPADHGPADHGPADHGPADHGLADEEFGLTDALDRLVERLGFEGGRRLLAAIDRRATVLVTSDRIEVRGLTGTRVLPLRHLKAVELRTPLAVGSQVVPFWKSLLGLVPGVRAGRFVRFAATALPMVTSSDPVEVDLQDLDRPVLSRLRRLGPNITMKGAPALVALLHPRLTERVLEEAQRHGIPVVAKR